MISIESDTSSDDPDLGVEEDIRRGGLTETAVHYRKRTTKRTKQLSCGASSACKKLRGAQQDSTVSVHTRGTNSNKVTLDHHHRADSTSMTIRRRSSKVKERKTRSSPTGKSSESVSISPREEDNTVDTKKTIKREESSKIKRKSTTTEPTKLGSARLSRSCVIPSTAAKPSHSSPSLSSTTTTISSSSSPPRKTSSSRSSSKRSSSSKKSSSSSKRSSSKHSAISPRTTTASNSSASTTPTSTTSRTRTTSTSRTRTPKTTSMTSSTSSMETLANSTVTSGSANTPMCSPESDRVCVEKRSTPPSPTWWSSVELTKEDEEFLHTEVELARDICNKKGESVVSDATDLMHHLANAYSTTTQSFVKPNVLVTGITGAGKSTLINSLFGKKLAATGTGVPITQHFTKYESPDTRAVVYDSKGLEHGHYEEFIETTTAFFKERENKSLSRAGSKHKTSLGGNGNIHLSSENLPSSESNDEDKDDLTDGGPIHVVWYIVNTAHARFEQFEQELCQRLFAPFPIFFLLNKADLSTQADRDKLRKVITSMALPNCCGIIDIIAEPEKKLKIGLDTCPACGSDDVQCRVKSGLLICGDCGHRESLVQEHGLDKVIRATLMILPALVKDNFVAAQNVILSLKDEMSRTVLAEFWEDFTSSTATTTTSLLNTIARMLCRLSNVWEFDGHGDEVGQLLASHLVSALKWKKQKKQGNKENKPNCNNKNNKRGAGRGVHREARKRNTSSMREEEKNKYEKEVQEEAEKYESNGASSNGSSSSGGKHRGGGGRGAKRGAGRGRSGFSGGGVCEVVLSEAQRVHVVSLGILWNFCLRELAQLVVHEWEKGLEEERGDELLVGSQTCSLLYQRVFSELREENLKLIENSLIERSVFEEQRLETYKQQNTSYPENGNGHLVDVGNGVVSGAGYACKSVKDVICRFDFSPAAGVGGNGVVSVVAAK